MASSLAQAESWCSSPNIKWSYDVFLSFRGEDTRSNFTSHLDVALRQKGVNFFIDDKLERGGQISKSLLKSIEGSRISIIIFSENYASSTWCLDEVVKITECMESKGQIVLPVFFKVNPSEVRKQTGRFGEALAKHEAKFMTTKIQTWKEALTTAAGLSGWDLATRKDEADLIQDLLREVLSKLNRTQLLHVAKHLVGIDSQLKAMELASHVISDGVYMVGIYGMGGIGKTTLAKALYNKIANQFEGCCFLSNVREASEPFNGLVQLQEKLLHEILKVYHLKVGNLDEGINIIRDRLCSKKVLILLDAVDKLEQLEALVGQRDWFGGGSKIIVTTRNKHLLSSHEFDEMHAVRGLDYDRALELFSWHAFKKSHPSSIYLDLSKLAVSYCNGLPLALVILGSLLHKRERLMWKSKLDELENSLEPGIEDVFQISFKGLQDKVKEIFLHISCFFVGEDVKCIKNMLKACDLNPDYGITILMDLSLVTVEDGVMQMHDLIQKMGQTIVCRESSELGKRSRLWVAKEVINMLKDNSGTDAVKAIKLDLDYNEVVNIDPKAFTNMKNLRLLILRNITFFTTIFEYLPNQLKWIEYYGYDNVFPSLPISFVVNDQLVGLGLTYTHVKHLGNRFENCERLKHVDLSCSILLEEVPDFSAALHLEELNLRYCIKLKIIHESIVSLSELITLDLEGCENLEKLPSYFMLRSLEFLNLSRCEKLQEIPELSIASNLKKLDLNGCINLRIIHESDCSLDKLVILNLGDCANLEKVPSYLMSKSLEFLNLRKCKKLKEIYDFSAASNIQRVYLGECTSLRIIHEFVGRSLDKLDTLDIKYCYNLKRLPSYFMSESLQVLDLSLCRKLKKFPDFSFEKFPSTLKLKSLRVVSLSMCDNLEEITDFSIASNLETLDLSCCFNLRIIHECIGSLDKLVILNLTDCSNLEELPNFSAALNLKKLYLRNCTSLRTIHESIGSLNKLVTLDLRGCSNVEKLPSYLRLKSLDCLNLGDYRRLEQLPEFDENMKSLRRMDLEFSAIKKLPLSIGNLTKLEFLSLRGCANLIALPSTIYLLESLERLCLRGCSKLFMFPQPSNLKVPQESLCSNLTFLDLNNCNILNVDFLETLSRVSTSLLELHLSGNKFSRLPTCLHNFTSLRELHIKNCKFLQEIPNLPQCIQIMDASGCESLVRSPDNIPDIIDYEFDSSKREFILMNGEIPELFSHQTRISSTSVNIQHHSDKGRALAACVVFKVNGYSDKAIAFISYHVLIDGKIWDSFWRRLFPSSTSEYMWLVTTPLKFSSLGMNDRHEIKVWFEVYKVYNAIVTIRSQGVHVIDGLQAYEMSLVPEKRKGNVGTKLTGDLIYYISKLWKLYTFFLLMLQTSEQMGFHRQS